MGFVSNVLIMPYNGRHTFSDMRLVTSVVRALREPTKYILTSVIALVMHCWKRSRYISASLKCRYHVVR